MGLLPERGGGHGDLLKGRNGGVHLDVGTGGERDGGAFIVEAVRGEVGALPVGKLACGRRGAVLSAERMALGVRGERLDQQKGTNRTGSRGLR